MFAYARICKIWALFLLINVSNLHLLPWILFYISWNSSKITSHNPNGIMEITHAQAFSVFTQPLRSSHSVLSFDRLARYLHSVRDGSLAKSNMDDSSLPAKVSGYPLFFRWIYTLFVLDRLGQNRIIRAWLIGYECGSIAFCELNSSVWNWMIITCDYSQDQGNLMWTRNICCLYSKYFFN